MTKTYITPKMKEPELVVQPAGKKDAHGNRIPRKAIQFRPNEAGVGCFKTSDPETQKFLDNHEYMALGEMMVLGNDLESPKGEPGIKTRVGLETSSDEPPTPPAATSKPVKAAKVKK